MTNKKGVYAVARQVYANYKSQAKRRELNFDISFDLFSEVIQQNCYYCGVEPDNFYKRTGVYYNGIDRIDNTIGYFPDNIVPCCLTCNKAKSKLSVEEFLAWAKRLAKHQFWLYENYFYDD